LMCSRCRCSVATLEENRIKLNKHTYFPPLVSIPCSDNRQSCRSRWCCWVLERHVELDILVGVERDDDNYKNRQYERAERQDRETSSLAPSGKEKSGRSDRKERGIIAFHLHIPTFVCRLEAIVNLRLTTSLLPVTSIDLALEENVNLTVRSTLHLRDAEVCGDETDETSTTPDVAALAADFWIGKLTVTLVGVEHVRGEENARDFDNVVGCATNTGGERAQTDGGGFTNDDPRCRSGTESEEHGNNQTKRGLGKVGSVDGSSAIEGGQDPGQHNEDHLESGSDETESEGEVVADTGLLEEVNGLVGNQITSQV
ncbi:putative sugar transporter, partial [Aureobasidium melanogenum]